MGPNRAAQGGGGRAGGRLVSKVPHHSGEAGELSTPHYSQCNLVALGPAARRIGLFASS